MNDKSTVLLNYVTCCRAVIAVFFLMATMPIKAYFSTIRRRLVSLKPPLLLLALLFLIGANQPLLAAADTNYVINTNGGQCSLYGANGGLAVYVGPTGQFQVKRCDADATTSSVGQYYYSDDLPTVVGLFNGLYLAIGNTIIGPYEDAGGNAAYRGDQAWTSVSGSGGSTLGDGTTEHVMTAVVDGLTYTLTQTVSYIFPRDYYSVSINLDVPAGNTHNLKLYSWTDLMLNGNDKGYCDRVTRYPEYLSGRDATGSVVAGYQQNSTTNHWDHYFCGLYVTPFNDLKAALDLSDTFNTAETDIGAAVQWSIGTVADTTFTADYDFVFSNNIPTLTKRYGPDDGDTNHTITTGQTTQLSLIVTNTSPKPAQRYIDFTETLPANVSLVGAPVASQCGGTVLVGTSGGRDTVTLADGELATGAATCEVVVDVTSTTSGVYDDPSENVMATRHVQNKTQAELTVLNPGAAFPEGSGLNDSVCSVTTPAGAYDSTGLRWSHNKNGGTDPDPTIDNTSVFASATAATFMGLTANINNYELNINADTIPATYDPAKYIEYTFTTTNFGSTLAEVFGVGLAHYNKGDPADNLRTGAYRFAIAIDDDAAFSSPEVLISDIQLDDGDVSNADVAAAPADMGFTVQTFGHYNANGQSIQLAASTTYKMRVYPYAVTANGEDDVQLYTNTVLWDDFMPKVATCAPKDHADAPTSGTSPNGTGTNAYGDAPHLITGGVQLGATITSEPNAVADADNASDDGITFPTLEQGQSATITATVSGTGGYLQGWIDWNGDGDFADAGEQVATDLQLATPSNASGTINIPVTPPANATTDQTFARFRWSTTAGLDAITAANDGEVEDYAVTVIAPAGIPFSCDGTLYQIFTTNSVSTLHKIEFTNGGASFTPIGTGAAGNFNGAYGYNEQDGYIYGLAFNGNGAAHHLYRVGADGAFVDLGEVPGLPSSGDVNAPFKYNIGTILPNGKLFFTYKDSSDYYTIDLTTNPLVFSTMPASGEISKGADWAYNPSDGYVYSIHQGNDQIIKIDPTNGVGVQVTTTQQFTSRYGAHWFDNAGNYYVYESLDGAFLRIDLQTGVSTQIATSVSTSEQDGASCRGAPVPLMKDYSDAPADGATAPDGTSVASYGVAIHTDINTLNKLGATITDETSAVFDADNTSDDGITFPTLTQGTAATITATVNGKDGYLQGWIDWNGDGDFADAGEQIATDLQLATPSDASGTISIPVTPPADAITDQTYARFRWSTDMGLDSTTAASDGEVEDYAFTILESGDTCILSDGTTVTITGEIGSQSFVTPSNLGTCTTAPYTGLARWTGPGRPPLVYTFSKALSSVDIVYTAVESNDAGVISTNAAVTPTVTVASQCNRVTVAGTTITNVLSGFGPANLTVASTEPFTQVILQGSEQLIHKSGCSGFTNLVGVYDSSDAPADGSATPGGTGTTSYGEATHTLVSTLQLGAAIDADSTSIASAAADGDGADDDGITIPALPQGETATITATVTGTGGYLQGWIDWDGNGAFDANEQVATNLEDSDNDELISFTTPVPATATANPTYARFRWSTTEDLDATTDASDGEVEDYMVQVSAPTEASVCTGGAVGGELPADDYDGDTICNFADLDDDNDGVLDTVECGTGLTTEVFNNPQLDLGGTTVDSAFVPPNWSNGTSTTDRDDFDKYYTDNLTREYAIHPSTLGWSSMDTALLVSVRNGAGETYENIKTTLTGLIPGKTYEYSFEAALTKYTVEGTPTETDITYGTLEIQVDGVSAGAHNLMLGDSAQRYTYTWTQPAGDTDAVFDLFTGEGRDGVVTGAQNPVFLVLGGSGRFAVANSACLDTDNDGLSNAFDLDSDGDSCPDAVDGGGAFTPSNLVASAIAGGNSGANYTGSSVAVQDNLGNTVDTDSNSATYGVPIVSPDTAAVAQGVGSSQDITIQSSECDTGDGLCYPAVVNLIDNPSEVSLSEADVSSSTDYTQQQTVLGQPSPLAPEVFMNAFDAAGGRGTFSFDYTVPKIIPVDEDGKLNLTFYQYDNIAGSSGGYVSTPRNVKIYTDQGELSDTWVVSNADATILDGGGWVERNFSFSVTPDSFLEITGLEIDMEANGGGTTSTTFSPSGSEVYALAISPLSACSVSIPPVTVVSGQVYIDANSSAAKESGEAGIGGSVVILRDKASGVCRSAKTKANGGYSFSDVPNGDYEVYQAHGETTPTPQTCDSALPKNPVGYQSTTPDLLEITMAGSDISNQNFGEVAGTNSTSSGNTGVGITFEPNHQSESLPGNVTFYAHTLTSEADSAAQANGGVRFTAVGSGNTVDGWTHTLYRDTDCSGTLNGTEGNTAISGMNFGITAGTRLCIINKVYAPANVPAQDHYKVDIIAAFTFPERATGPVTLPVTLAVNDLTTAGQAGGSRLELTKTVENMDQMTGETMTLNEASPGDVLRYRIYYHNTGVGVITDLNINDTVPPHTSLVASSETCVVTPSGMTCTPTHNAGALDWAFTGSLAGGANGYVRYEVKVDE